jgi:hypothetical protein
MKNILKTGLFLLLFTPLFVGCETVEDVVLPRNEKPLVNITTTDVSVMGETNSTITITTNTISKNPQIFKLVQVDGTAVMDADYNFEENSALDYGEIGGLITIPAYASSGSTTIAGISDFIDGSKSASFKLEAIQNMAGVVTSPDMMNITISDFFDPEKLNIVFSWDAPNDGNDYDMVTWSAAGGEWGDGGAGSGNPEYDDSIWTADPDGTYYVNVMEWGYGVDFNYHFVILNTDGSIQKFDGTFKGSNTSIYVNDNWLAWGGSGYDSFRMLKVVKSGSSFTVTAL